MTGSTWKSEQVNALEIAVRWLEVRNRLHINTNTRSSVIIICWDKGRYCKGTFLLIYDVTENYRLSLLYKKKGSELQDNYETQNRTTQ